MGNPLHESPSSLVGSFSEHALNTHCIPGPALGGGGTAVKSEKKTPKAGFHRESVPQDRQTEGEQESAGD